ncbi:MAG: hypothetical protein ABII10_00565 [Candidatus Paceibacterota bacterium]
MPLKLAQREIDKEGKGGPTRHVFGERHLTEEMIRDFKTIAIILPKTNLTNSAETVGSTSKERLG